MTTLQGEPLDDYEGRVSTGGIYRTDENGEIVLLNVQPGAYRVTETKAPEGYVLDAEAQTVTVNPDDAQTLVFRDTALQSVTIRKYIDGTTKPLPGVTFLVTDANGGKIGEYVTDENGEILITGLAPGMTLVAREVKTVKGYALNGTPQTIQVGVDAALQSVPAATVRGAAAVSPNGGTSGNSMTFYDEPLSTLVIRKYVKGTANQPLAGVTFKVVDGNGANVGNSDGIYITDDSGEIVIPNLEQGTVVKVREIRTVNGYLLDGKEQDIEIRNSELHELTFWNEPVQTLTIRKYAADTSTPLSGVTFHVTGADGKNIGSSNGNFITDRNGEIVISNLTPGDVLTVKETKTVSGYVLDSTPQTVKIQSGEAQTLTLYNAPKGSLTVVKRDKFTDEPLSGAEFKVTTTAKGEAVPANEGQTSTNGVYVTDAHGQFTIGNILPGVYVVTETKAPEGYILDSIPQTVTVEANDAQTLTFHDMALQTLTVQKYVTGTTTPIPGAAFLVVDDDGQPVGENNGEYLTDENGRFILTGLKPGATITVKEIRAAEGYVLDGTPKSIKMKSGAAQSVMFYNVPEQTLIIQKYAADSTTPIQGASFHITDTDGKTVGSSSGDFITDRNGQIILSGLTPGVSVTAKETNAPAGYVLDSTPQTVKIQSGEAQTMVFYNAPKGSLTVVKRDRLTDAPLSGAEFKVTTPDGTAVDQDEGRISASGIYRTDESGRFLISALTPGTYVVTETKAPQGYVLDAEAQTVKINADDAQTLTFRDTALQTLTITKYVEGTTKPLPGVTFLVTDSNGANVGVGEYVTDENGRIVLTGLTPGMTVIAREVRTVRGYALNGTPQVIQIGAEAAPSAASASQAVLASAGTGNNMTFTDSPLSTLVIHNYVEGTENQPLPGVTVKVVDGSGRNVGNADGLYVSDENGDITIPNLEQDTVIKVRQIRTVDGYILNGNPQDIEIHNSDLHELTFWNTAKKSLIIRKYAADSSTPIPGVTFHVSDTEGKNVGSSNGDFVTDSNGEIVLDGLTPGMSVTIRETKAASGYVLDPTPQTVKIQSGETQTVVFYNAPKSSLTVVILDRLTEKPLTGAEFKVTTVDGAAVDQDEGQTSTNGTYRTDENGRFTISGLNPGSYVVTEVKAPQSYVLDAEAQTVRINANDAQILTFRNAPTQTLTVEICVTDSTTPIPGATFLVVDQNGKPVGSSNGEFTADENGRISIPSLTPGVSVTVKEIRAAEGYIPDGTPKTILIQSGEAQSLRFFNSPTQTLTVQLYEAGTTDPISGATFHIVDGDGKNVGSSNGDFVTDKDGRITITGLLPGVTIKAAQTNTASGFVLDTTPQTITIREGEAQTLTFYAAPKSSLTVVILDRLTEKPLSGAEFKVTTADGTAVDQDEGRTSTNGTYRTDENGRFIISGLNPGSYVVTETKAPRGYVLDADAQTVKINANDAQTLTFRNAPTQTLTVEIYVTDSTTPIPGTPFLVVDQNGKPVGSSNGEYTADENGRIVIPSLTPGVSVTVKEIRAADGYILDGTPKTILIRSGDAQSLRFYNNPTQTLTVQLYEAGTTDPIFGAAFYIVTGDGKNVGSSNGDFVTDKDGRITIPGLLPGVTIKAAQTKPVSGYVLDTTPQTITIREGEAQTLTFYAAPKGALVLKARDSVTEQLIAGVEFRITTVSGESLDSNEGKTSSNGIFRTDDTGQLTLTNVQPGLYSIVETKVPDGYVLNEDPQTVEIHADDTQTVVFNNTPKQTLTIQVYESGTTNPIPGIAFLLKDSGGAFIGPDRGEYVTDGNGQIMVSGLTPGVTVAAQEIRTVSGYVLNSVPKNIKIQTGDAQKLTFFNEPTQILVIQKFQKGTTKPLQGVAFLVVDGNGAPVGSGKYVTDENGRVSIEGLEPGMTVTAREIRTIQGYQLNGNPQNIRVSADKQNILTFYDDPLSVLILRLYIDGTENEPLSGAAFKVVDGSGKAVGPDDGVSYTDHAGMVTLANLEPGVTVKARLFKVPEGFALDGTPQDILMDSGNVQSLTFWAKRAGSLTIRALDSVTRAGVPNVEYKVTYADGRPVDTANGNVSSNGRYFTDSSGEIRITGIVGTVVVTEESTADNYTMDAANRTQTVVVNPSDGQTLTFFETPAQSLAVQLYVKGTTTPISGAGPARSWGTRTENLLPMKTGVSPCPVSNPASQSR